MQFTHVHSRSHAGLEAPSVTVEIHLTAGLPHFQIVGLGDAASRQVYRRVRSALLSSHFKWPDFRITVNLAPTDLPKGGTRFDLPIALGLLVASGQLPAQSLDDREFFGELGLDGCIHSFHGALAAAMEACRAHRVCGIAAQDAEKIASVTGGRILAAPDLMTLCALLKAPTPGLIRTDFALETPERQYPDLAELEGQPLTHEVLKLAAAGGHHLLMSGPPGVGKTLAASILPGLLPDLPPDTQRQVNLLRDLAGLGFVNGPPLRQPHHSSSIAALMGGTAKAIPGEISMAHGGVLFLDELTEFPRPVLNQLRQPLESGEIWVSRAAHQHRYPAQFQLVAAMNPCPCGHAGSRESACRCTPDSIRRYRQGASGPLMDRIDLHVTLRRPPPECLLSGTDTPDYSATVRPDIATARERQLHRQGVLNRDLRGENLIAVCSLSGQTQKWLIEAMKTLHLSARSTHRRLRVARTIADLEGSASVTVEHLNTAVSLREAPTDTGAVQA